MTLTKKRGVYHVNIPTPKGSKSISTGCTDKTEAAKVVRESGTDKLAMAAKAGRLTTQVIGQITTGRKLTLTKAIAAFAEWMDSIGRAPKSVYNSVTVLTRWVTMQKLESAPPSSITEKQISQWINHADTDSGAANRAASLGVLNSFFDFCAAKGWAMGNPARLVRVNMQKLSHEQKERKVLEPFSKLETNRLLKHTEEAGDVFWNVAIRIDQETGLRLGDICALEWDCFKKAGHITVWTDKRDKRVAIPMSEALQEAITTIPVLHPQYVFPDQRTIVRDPKRRSYMSVQFSRLCAACEIDGKSFHGFRHTFVTELKRQGKTLEEIGTIVGHSDTKTTQGYVHED